MSLVDFDDDAGFHATGAPTASFNGHTSIDDPFGFNVFGTGSTGTKTTTVTETVFTGNNDKFFDDFDPLAGFGDDSNKHEVSHTTRVVTTTTTSSDTQPKGDAFNPFGDFAPNGSGEANQVTSFETSKQSWVDDDFGASDRNGVTSHDLERSGSLEGNEVEDEKTGVVIAEHSLTVNSSDDPFWTSQSTSLVPTSAEQDVPASPHSDGVFPHSNTDAIDEILGDLHEETAPKAEMEDLSPVKPMEDKTSSDRDESLADSQFNFDGLSENQMKPGNGSGKDVEFMDDLNEASIEMKDALKAEINDGKQEAVELEAANNDKPSSFVNTGEFSTKGNFDNISITSSDHFLAGDAVPRVDKLNGQENLNFNVASDNFLAGNSVERGDSQNDFNAQENFELDAVPADNPFVTGNFVPRNDSLDSERENFDFNSGASNDTFLCGNSVPREGSPSVEKDVEIFHQLEEEVIIEERASVLDENISKGATKAVDSMNLLSDSKASTNAFSYEPETNFRPKESEQRAAAVPETVYNKMYNYRQDNSWKQKEMDVKDSGPVQFQLNSRRKEEPEEVTQKDEEEDDEDEGPSSDQFFEDVKDRSRGRISIEEIRQRSYEDFGPVSSSRKDQKPVEKSPVVYVLGAAGDNVCKVCAKRVYEMEKVTADLQVYHKTCFRCHHCNRILSLGNFSTNDGRLYCKPHFIEIFKTKGNYKDSFALAEQQKLRGDNGRGDDSSSQDPDETDSQRNRRTPSGYVDDDEGGYDDYEEEENRQRTLKEEMIPTVPIKSVRNIFEKMSQDVVQPAQQQQHHHQQQQKKPTTKASSTAHAEPARRPTQEVATERVRNDSEKSDLEIDRHRLLERRDSTSEVIQSSTTCIVEDELPPPAHTRSLLAKFKMMEDSQGAGNKAPVAYGAPVAKQTQATKQTTQATKQTTQTSKQTTKQTTQAPKQTTQAAQHHQTLSYRSSGDSRASNEPEEIRVGRDAPDSIVRSTSQDRKDEDRTDELPQAGLAKSLLAQWRNLEEQSKRGRSREPRSSANARRSQSMSRVETVQRARMYPVVPSARSKQVEDIRPDDYSDEEAGGNDLPSGGVPTKQRLGMFQGFDYGAGSSDKPKKAFKWEVKEPLPMNRGVLIVHGDVPRKPNPEEAAAASASAARWSDSANEYATVPEHRRSATDDDDDSFQAPVSDDVVHGTTTTVIIEEELPPPAMTRTLLQHFKSMEDVTKAPPRPRVAPAQADRDHAPKTKQAAVYINDEEDEHDRTHHSSSANGDENDFAQYEGSPESGEFGNDPVHDPSVIRESDRFDEEELPAQGTTKSLLAKFQSFQGKR